MSFPQSSGEDTRYSGGTVTDDSASLKASKQASIERLAQYKFPYSPNDDLDNSETPITGSSNENMNPEAISSLRPPTVGGGKCTASIPCAGRMAQRRFSNGTDSQSLFEELENPPNSPMSIAGSYMSGNSAASSRRPSVTLLAQTCGNTNRSSTGPASNGTQSRGTTRSKDEMSKFTNISTMVVERLQDLMQDDESIFKGRRGSVGSMHSTN